MRVRVLAFARLGEILEAKRELDLPEGARVGDAWSALCSSHPALRPLAESTRFARNGRVVNQNERLENGDELALLPPVGGG